MYKIPSLVNSTFLFLSQQDGVFSLMLRSNACGRRVELMRTKLCGNLIKINTVINNLHNENYARNAPPVGKLK